MIPQHIIKQAQAIVQRTKALYPGCEGAKNFDFGAGPGTNLPAFKLNGAPPANTQIGFGVDFGATDYGAFSRAILPVADGALYARYPKTTGNINSLSETTNNISLAVSQNDLYDIVLCNFGTTDAAKTITLADLASKWQGRRLLLGVNKQATSGSRAVTLLSSGSENVLVPIGGGAPTNSVTLIAGTTGGVARGVMLVGDAVYIYVFAA